MGALDDWSGGGGGGGGSSTTTTVRSSPSGSALDDWSGGGSSSRGASQASSAGGGGGSGGGGLLGSILHHITALPGEAAHIAGAAIPGLFKVAKDVAATNYNEFRQFIDPVVAEPAYLKALDRPGVSALDRIKGIAPAASDVAQPTVNAVRYSGGIGEDALHLAHLDRGHHGLSQEFNSRFAAHPLGTTLEFAAGLLPVAGVAARGLGLAADATESSALAGAAEKAGAIRNVAGHVAGAPFAPARLLSKLPTMAGEAGYNAVMNAAAEGERAPLTARLAAPLSPAFRDLKRTLVEGDVAKKGDLAAVNRTAAAAEHIAPDPVTQQVATEVAQGTAPALTAARNAAAQAGRPDLFDQFVADRYQGTLSSEAAHHLADIGSGGGSPEVLAKANEYLATLDRGMGSRGVGSMSALSDRYQAAHPEQAGFEPIMHDPTADPNEITAAPSRLRPLLAENRAAQQFADELGHGHQTGLASTLADVRAGGLDARYIPHMQEGVPAKGAGGGGSVALPQLRTITSEHVRTGEPVYDRTIKGVSRGLSEQTAKHADLRTAEQVTQLPQVVRLNEGPLEGVSSVAAAKAKGYVPWDPKALFETGSFRPLTDEQIAAGDMSKLHFIPKPMFDRFRNYFQPQTPGPAGEAFDKVTRATYKTTLHGTPYFAKMYALQNAGLVNTRGEVSIPDMIRLAPKAIQAMRTGEFPELQGRLPIGDTAEAPSKMGALRKVGRSLAGGAPRVIDGFSKTLVALNKIDKGSSPEEAILEANRTMGMYNAQPTAAQALIRRVFPIYPWAAHVLQAMGEFAGDHPAKATFLLHLGAAAAHDEELRQTPEFQRGMIPMGGGKVLDLKDLNPLSIFGGGSPVAFMNPVLRAAAGAGLGLKTNNLGSGKSPELSRPPTANQHGPLNLSEAEHFIMGQTPLGHALQSLREAPVRRFDTGEPKLPFGKPVPQPPTQPYWQHLLGIPVMNEAQPTSPKLQARLAKIAKSQDKAAAKYTKARARSGL